MNPFADEGGVFSVLLNQAGQYSIWPTFVDVPAGWSVCLGEVSREEALRYVDENWAGLGSRA